MNDSAITDLHGQQLVPGWAAVVREGLLPASAEQTYDTVRSLLNLPDDDVTMHVLSALITREEDGLWTIPLNTERLAQLLRHKGELRFVVKGLMVWVDVESVFFE